MLTLINIVFFSLICPHYSETPANLKTASPSQGFQMFRQWTAGIHDWYFYKALSGHCVSIILNFDYTSFHTANKTNTHKQTKSNRSMWTKTTCHFPRITEGWIPELHNDLTKPDERIPTYILQWGACWKLPLFSIFKELIFSYFLQVNAPWRVEKGIAWR